MVVLRTGESELRETAQRRTRRRFVIVASVVAGCVAAGTATGVIASGRDTSVGSALIIAAGAALVVAGILVIVWAVQKRIRNAPLVSGADKATQRAVRAALGRGHADDPDVDALVQDLIERSPTPRWVPYVYPVFAAFFLALLVMGDRDPWDVVRTVVLVVMSLLAGGGFWLHLRRLRRYRGLAPAARHHDAGHRKSYDDSAIAERNTRDRWA